MKMKTCNRKPAIIRAMLVMTMVLALTGALTACRAADKAESAIESGLDGGRKRRYTLRQNSCLKIIWWKG